MGELIGVNSRVSDPLSWQKKFGFVREYHEWANDINYDSDRNAGPPTQKYRWNPSYDIANALVSFDVYYATLAGKAVPVTKGLAPEMRGYVFYPWCPELLEQKPIYSGINYTWEVNCPPGDSYSSLPDFKWLTGPALENHQSPALYADHAKWNTLLAARYGTGYSNYLLNYPAAQTAEPFSRLPRLRYIENGNEPEKSWFDTGHGLQDEVANLTGNTYWQMTAPQYAAQLSADFDGHGRSQALAVPELSDRFFGIYNSAPQTKVVMAGLADLRVGYINAMKNWFESNRVHGVMGFDSGPLYPFDVLNFHHFSSSNNRSLSQIFAYEDIANNPLEGSTNGICPECDDLRGDLSSMLNEINAIDPVLGDKEVWLSEFGYDAHYGNGQTPSSMRVPISDPVKRHLRQAQWLVRSFLEISAAQGAGHYIQKAMVFDLRDNASRGYDGGLFDHCGLLSNDFQPKRSWYYVQTLRNVLKDYRFKQDVSQLDFPEGPGARNSCNIAPPYLRVYEFDHKDDPAKKIFVVWRWGNGATHILDDISCTLEIHKNVFGNTALASRIEMVNLDESGRKYTQTVTPNGAYMDLPMVKNLGETPMFIIPGVAAQDPKTPLVSQVSATTACCGAVRLSWTLPNQFHDPVIVNHIIYYTKDEEIVGEAAKFEMNQVTLFNNTWQNSIVIPGLVTGATYRFFVIPVDNYGNIPDLNQSGALAQLSVKFTVADCNGGDNTCLNPSGSCILKLGNGTNDNCFSTGYAPNETYTCFDNNGGQVSINLFDRAKETFGLFDSPEESCAPLHNSFKAGCPGDGWTGYDYKHPGNNYVEIHVGSDEGGAQAVKVNTIYLYDIQGVGDILVEYKNCACGDWQFYKRIRTNKYNEWVAIYDLPNVAVNQLRFTKTDDQANVARIYLCTEPTPCSQAMQGYNPGNFTGLKARDIESRAAELNWNALAYNRNDPKSALLDGYTLRYSTKRNDSGALVNPVELGVEASQFEKKVNYRLGGLEPQTTYFVEVVGARMPPYRPCINGSSSGAMDAYPKQATSFTTSNEVAIFRNQGAARENHVNGTMLEIYPNPGSGRALVNLPSSGFREITVYNAEGGLVQTIPLNAHDLSVTINLEKLPGGVYALTARNENGEVAHARYVKQ